VSALLIRLGASRLTAIPETNEAQRHLMKIAATNPFVLVQLSPVPMHLKGRRDFESKRELEFVDADDLIRFGFNSAI